MKLKNKTLAWLLALGAAAALPEPSAEAASAANGDILVGFRATGGTGNTKNLVVNIGAATALESATGTVNLGNINADLTATYGSDWANRNNLFWGAVGAVGSFADIGTNPAKTVYGSRSTFQPWLRANSASHAGATNKVVGLMTAFGGASSAGVSHPNGVSQLTTATNSWSSYQPGGTITNSGPTPGISFAFFNPSIEGAVASDTALIHLYRVKPATTSAEINTPGDYLGMLVLESSGSLAFEPAASLARLSIVTPVVSVLQGATTATVLVRRVPGTGAGADASTSVLAATANGTTSVQPPFTPAMSGRDYTSLSSTITFAANEYVKPVTVALTPTLTAITNRRFTVSLSTPAANAVVGAASASVQIISDTAASPTIRFTNPSGISSTTVWPVVASGIVGSPIGVDRVEVSLNGGTVVTATLSSATSPLNVPWSANFQPVEGTNRLVATVYDLAGNSSTVRRSFRFARRYQLTLTRQVPAPISATPDTAGLVAMLATPATNATAMLPATLNSNPRSSEVLPGTTVRLTASTKPGYSFSHWSGSITGSATVAGDVLSFTMPVGDVAVTAVYTVNVFGGSANQTVGTFVGLVRPDGPTVSNNETEGFISGTLTSSTGLFAGRLLIGGVTTTFTGNFYGNGDFYFTVGANKQPILSLGGGRSLQLKFSADTISVMLTNATSGDSDGDLRRAIYSTTSKVPGALLNSPTKGTYTIGFPSKAQSPELASSLFPQGDGIGTITVLDTGAVTLAGTLADGTAVTASSNLVAGNQCPIFVQLNTPGSTTVKGGSFGGVLTFDSTQADSDVSGVDLRWFRPAVVQPTTPNPVMDLYTDGWPSGIKVDAVGALYDATQTAQSSLGITATASANTDLVFDNLRYRINSTTFAVRGASYSPRIVDSVVSLLPSGTSAYTLSVVQATGAFSGTVTADATAKPPYRGIIIQKGANKGGYGHVISASLADRDPQSGGVSLTKK